jgi:murein DD-endopeptidase MepM/ murein hydrolase activator NlpD
MLTVLTAALLALTVTAPAYAEGQTGDAVQKAKDARAELEAITARVERFTADLHTNELQLEQAKRRAKEAERRYQTARANLSQQAAILVRSGGGNLLESLLDQDAENAVDRLEFVDVMMRQRTDWVVETKEAEAAYESIVRDIEERTAASRKLANGLKDERAKLDDKFRQAKAELLSGGGLASAEGVDGIAEVAGGIACPVEPPYTFINSWGFARSGGRRHKGTDIMAPLGATVFAYADGVVTKTSSVDSGLAGRQVQIKHPGGVDTWYFHLNTVKVSSGKRVQAGQVIGTNGNSGNATVGGEHVHFEYHVGGTAVNPYPFVAKACTR